MRALNGDSAGHWGRDSTRIETRIEATRGAPGAVSDDCYGAVLAKLIRALDARSAVLVWVRSSGEPVFLGVAGEAATRIDDLGRRLTAVPLPSIANGVERCGGWWTRRRSGGGGLCVEIVPLRNPAAAAVSIEALLALADRNLSRREDRASPVSTGSLRLPEGFVTGPSRVMESLLREVGMVAPTDVPVLIRGETGVGKELVARTIHLSSRRSRGPFVAVNCAAIPRDLLEAEMFGIERGVATGVEPRKGRFQLATGGTLLLDEIGEMAPSMQAKILRTLQDGEVVPIGGRPVGADVRIVAATNAQLEERVRRGSFRQDLYYRLASYTLAVPPLRDRREEIPVLAEQLVRRFARGFGKSVPGLTLSALQRLTSHPWPGNVRELENEVRRAVLLCADGEPIEAAALLCRQSSPLGTENLDLGASSLAQAVEALERRLIEQALEESSNNQSEAARRLGLSRNGLAKKLQRLRSRPSDTGQPR